MHDEEYSAWFDKVFAKMTRNMEDHTFKHFNQSMGIHIENKAHYKYEMKRRRMIPYDAAHDLADEYDRTHKRQDYDGLSPKAAEIIRSLRMGADSKGNIIIGTAGIKALKEIGWIPTASDHIPKDLALSGGFR